MRSQAYQQFEMNKKQIGVVIDRIAILREAKRNHGDEIEIHKRTVMTLTCAAWEAFVEELCAEALEHMVAHPASAKDVPEKLQEIVWQHIESVDHPKYPGNTSLKPWLLADDGWQAYLKPNLKSQKTAALTELNTPNSRITKDLYERSIGLRNINSAWVSKTKTPEQLCAALNAFIGKRGDCAHGLAFTTIVKMSECRKFLALVSRLAALTDSAVAAHVNRITRKCFPQ